MMTQRLLLVTAFIVLSNFTFSQSTQDTIDNPYWLTMKDDHSNNYYNIVRAYNLYFSNKPKEKGTGWKQFERWAYFWQYNIDSAGNFLPNDHTIKEINKYKLSHLQTRSSTGNWESYGPFVNPTALQNGDKTGVGRINTVRFHPTDANTMYAGTPQGGFWITNNHGTSWHSSTDYMPTLGVSDIAVIPNATSIPTILIGSGDRDAGDAVGLGVFKSTDGGVSFSSSNTGMPNDATVNMFAVNPINPNTIFAGTSKGIYATYNAGSSWTKKSYNSQNYKDIKYCPNDTSTIYATSAASNYYGANCDFYRSGNAGNTWVSINTGLTSTNRQRMVIGVTEHNPDIVYLLASNSAFLGAGLESFYKSSNKGASFTPLITGSPNLLGWLTNGSDNKGQGWYDIAIIVSPTDSNTIMVGGVNTWRSTNGGVNWTIATHWTDNYAPSTPYMHADVHSMTINPLNSQLFIGHDGGIDYTTNYGLSVNNISDSLAITQIYNTGISQLATNRYLIGCQDNGTSRGLNKTWDYMTGGDGSHCEISNFNTNKMIASSQYGSIKKSTNGGNNWSPASSSITDTSAFITPLALHPRVDNFLIGLYQNIFINSNVFSSNTYTQITSGKSYPIVGTAIRYSNIDDNLAFFGWGDGTVSYCDNLLSATPTQTTTSTILGGGLDINDIETSYTNANILWVAKGNSIFESNDKGSTWSNITFDLPNIAVTSLVLDKNTGMLYAGTKSGVYMKDAGSTSWFAYNTGLPLNSQITDLDIVYDTICAGNSKIYAATYGRGLWIGDLFVTETQPVPNFTMASEACANQTVPINNTSTEVNTNTVYEWTITPSAGVTFVNGTNSNSQHPSLKFATQANYTITLKATNPGEGFCTITKSNVISIGNAGTLGFLHGNDTTICPGVQTEIKVTGMETYIWPTGMPNFTLVNDSTALVFPTTQTSYQIVGDIAGSCKDTVIYIVYMSPTASYTISGNTTYCEKDSTRITISDVDSVIWSPLTDLTFLDTRGKDVRITAQNTIDYNLVLKSTGLCDAYKDLQIKVLKNPSYILNQPDSFSICRGDTAMIIETNVPNKEWYPSYNTINSVTKDTFYCYPTKDTVYHIKTTNTDYCPIEKTFKIKVKDVPVLSVVAPKDFCYNDSALITVNGANAYNWTPSTDLRFIANNKAYSYSDVDIVYTIEGFTDLCSSTITVPLTVGQVYPNLALEGDSVLCSTSKLDLVASGADKYLWSPEEVVNNPYNANVRVQTNSDVTLILVGNNSGCRDTIFRDITVESSPTISITKSNNSAICQGDSVVIAVTGASQYALYPFYNADIIDYNKYLVRPYNDITYYLVGYSINNCFVVDSTTIDVNPAPNLTVAPQVSTMYTGDSVVLLASGANSYVWTPDSSINGSASTNEVVVRPSTSTLYKVVGSSSENCKSEMYAVVNVIVDYSPVDTSTTTSISWADNKKLTVFPIPTSDLLHINSEQRVNYKIYDMMGRIVAINTSYSNLHDINIEHLSSSNYILYLETPNREVKQIRIEVKK